MAPQGMTGEMPMGLEGALQSSKSFLQGSGVVMSYVSGARTKFHAAQHVELQCRIPATQMSGRAVGFRGKHSRPPIQMCVV